MASLEASVYFIKHQYNGQSRSRCRIRFSQEQIDYVQLFFSLIIRASYRKATGLQGISCKGQTTPCPMEHQKIGLNFIFTGKASDMWFLEPHKKDSIPEQERDVMSPNKLVKFILLRGRKSLEKTLLNFFRLILMSSNL